MVISGSLGRQVALDIENMPHIQSIYIFCGNETIHEALVCKISKVMGVRTEIEPICKALQTVRENCGRVMVWITFNNVDALFMYTQLLKEAGK